MTPSGGEERKRTRRSEEEDSNTLYIPEEIVLNLVSRLPGKSLSRFKCVCKRWCSLIAISRQNKKLLLLSDKSLLHSVDQHGTLKPVAEPWQRYLSPPRYGNARILGSCDGLVLIRLDQYLFLWNPLTRYFKKVWSTDAWNVNIDSIYFLSGLCYDSSTDEYKAVLANKTSGPEYLVASLRSKSRTEVQFPYAKFWLNPGPIVNGHLHWFATKSSASGKPGYYGVILKFNPHTNEFTKVIMPQREHGQKNVILGLGALDGCLCMAQLDNQKVELLVMKGSFGVEKTWHAMFTISNSTTGFKIADRLVPLYSTTNGEVLVKTRIWKDMERITIKAYKANHEVLDREIHTAHICIDAVQYEESLVEPIGYELKDNWEEEELPPEPKDQNRTERGGDQGYSSRVIYQVKLSMIVTQ